MMFSLNLIYGIITADNKVFSGSDNRIFGKGKFKFLFLSVRYTYTIKG